MSIAGCSHSMLRRRWYNATPSRQLLPGTFVCEMRSSGSVLRWVRCPAAEPWTCGDPRRRPPSP